MTVLSKLNLSLQVAALATIAVTTATVSALDWPTKPLSATVSAKPLTMLIAGKDHKFFYEAYNDASDIDGDGILDTRFKPGITYYGLYDSTLCYGYGGTGNAGLFQPIKAADAQGRCLGTVAAESGQWSGNWLNYVTTSRIDALRKVLYGGTREVDSTSQTVLRRSYIPQDAHSWGKEYHRSHGYNISDYTDLADLTADNVRHFFGNLTANRATNCTTLDTCSNLPPLLRIRTTVGNNARIWEWASKERPVLQDNLSSGNFPAGTGNERNLTVRVAVCTTAFNSGCKRYPNGQYKPVGLLHDYGETDAMLFGLITGSYDQHLSGGRLRKVVSSFSNEITPSTGQFVAGASIVTTFDKLRIRGFNQSGNSSEYWKSNPYTDSAKTPTEGELVDWGNPIGEMMYEGIRYFSGKKVATSAYNTSTTFDNAVGLSSATWDDPYDKASSAAKASFCSRANFLTISDINPSFDGDQLPGSYWNVRGTSSKFTGDIGTINSELLAKTIGDVEALTNELFFIGEVGTNNNAAPTPKSLTSLGRARGLSPEEPTKQGSFSAAAMAYYAKTVDLRPEAGLTGNQSIDTYSVALSSPLPRIEATLSGGRKISLVPFAKSIGGSGINRAKGNYQPTNQIVDFYVEQIANSSGPTGPDYDASVNGGRYYARFQINYEDVEQGGDHDMDAIAEYTVQVTAANTLQVIVRPTYQAGGMQQNMGYVISGTTKDGVYLVAQDEAGNPAYYLNVPTTNSLPNGCDLGTVPANCAPLPTIGQTPLTFEFSPSATGGASLLKDPLWYASKWGGFSDRNNSKTPDLTLEWDADGNGVPDSYFLVQNPLKLRESLKKAFDNIVQRSGSGGSVIANSTSTSANSLVYQGSFNAANWSGDLAAFRATATGLNPIAQWRAADNIPPQASRRIIYRSPINGASREFNQASMASTPDWANFGNTDAQRGAMVRYLRGERSGEIQNGGTFRNRLPSSVLGDISHSSPAYSDNTKTVFIGANDGMLHAFNADTGVERFAFIPSNAMPTANDNSSGLRALSRVIYNDQHQYFVDGDLTISTRNQLNNKNYLVGTLGRGGKGVFALDVTNPDSFSGADVLWESAKTEQDMGYVLGRPLIARMENGAWVAIVGNGYNSRATSSDSRAVLFIYDLASGTLLSKIDTGVAGDNGLATPGLFDADNNGRIDAIYAGDLKGNVWKFDVSSPDVSTWSVALGGQAMFRAVDSTNKPQPITGELTITRNTLTADPNTGRIFIHFGTGSYFQTTDQNNPSQHTLYGLIDRGTVIDNQFSPSNKLVKRQVQFIGNLAGSAVRTFEKATVDDMANKDGYFMNLPGVGERIVTATVPYNVGGPTLIFSSIVPVFDECTPGGSGFINIINPYTGGRIERPFFNINKNDTYADDVMPTEYQALTSGATGSDNSDRFISSFDPSIGLPGQSILIQITPSGTGGTAGGGGTGGNAQDPGQGDFLIVTGGSDNETNTEITEKPRTGPPGGNNGGLLNRGRLSWREIVRD